jgi:chromosome partitioning protein
MRTVAVIALKGGSGKTTVATHIALAAHLRGRDVVVADSDRQCSSTDALKARQVAGPRCVNAIGADLSYAQFGAVRAGADLMMIDTAAGAVDEVGQAIVLADLVLLVVRPTLLDIAALVRTLEMFHRLQKPVFVVVNQAPVAREGIEAPVVRRALRALEYLRLPVAPAILRHRSAYQTALEAGRSVEETADTIAAAEVAALWGFLERQGVGVRARPPVLEMDGQRLGAYG